MRYYFYALLGLATLVFLNSCGSPSAKENDSAPKLREVPSKKASLNKPAEKTHEALASFDVERAEDILSDYFSKYGEKDFKALQDFYASEVEQFLLLKDLKAKEVSEVAQDFFRDKDAINYYPDLEEITYAKMSDHYLLTFPLTMYWFKNNQEAKDGPFGYTGRHVEVLLKLKLDHAYKIRSYEEAEIMYPDYEILEDMTVQHAQDQTKQVQLKKGTIVKDNLERRSITGMGEQMQIIYRGEKYWADQYENGFSRAGIELLRRLQ